MGALFTGTVSGLKKCARRREDLAFYRSHEMGLFCIFGNFANSENINAERALEFTGEVVFRP